MNFQRTRKEKNDTLNANIKGFFGKHRARKLINWLEPCCPFQLDSLSAEQADKFVAADWPASFIYVSEPWSGGAAGLYFSDGVTWIEK